MSVSADDLLKWAELEQHKGDEIGIRASISRAYYAAYHSALEFHKDLLHPGDAPETPCGLHKKLCHQLQNPSQSITDNNIKRMSRFKGRKLQELHQIRVKADYGLDETMGAGDVIDACGRAARIMGKHLAEQFTEEPQPQQPGQT